MKKTFKNFVLLTLTISVMATLLIELSFYLIDEYTYLLLAGIFFTSLIYLLIKQDLKNASTK